MQNVEREDMSDKTTKTQMMKKKLDEKKLQFKG